MLRRRLVAIREGWMKATPSGERAGWRRLRAARRRLARQVSKRDEVVRTRTDVRGDYDISRRWGKRGSRRVLAIARQIVGFNSIREDNPVGVIDVFVDELDLAELGFSGVDTEVLAERDRQWALKS
jgi:hypothetical protein